MEISFFLSSFGLGFRVLVRKYRLVNIEMTKVAKLRGYGSNRLKDVAIGRSH